MIEFFRKIINSHCKHREINVSFEGISNYTYRVYETCCKCGKQRKSLVSDGCKIVGEWK